MAGEGARLDPADRAAFRREAHRLLDLCLDRMDAARDHAWRPPEGLDVALDGAAREVSALVDEVAGLLPHGTSNTHPRFFGWVHGTGSYAGLLGEMAAAAMNANLGGRWQGAAEVEAEVIRWAAGVAGLPPGAFGVLTTGTSQATLLALQAARIKAGGGEVVYGAEGAHSCIAGALGVMGPGRGALRSIPLQSGQMDTVALAGAIAADRAAGRVPLAVVATAGSVNLGLYDDIAAVAEVARAEGLWLHVDGAFGLWSRLAEPPWRDLAAGVEKADSIAADFHKWIGAPYACGVCMVRDSADLRRAFSDRPDYLRQGAGLAGGEVWFSDYGLDLSRGFKALPVWATIRAAGDAALGAAITDNCRQAALMGALAEASEVLDLAHPVVSNLCCIAPRAGDAGEIAAALQLSGEAVFSTTRIAGREVLRAAIVNHRTTSDDIRLAVAAVEREVRVLP